MAKKQKKEPEPMHQHIDNLGKPFGQPHPANAIHKKESTQKYHILNQTVEYPRSKTTYTITNNRS
jgi:hypothetical protein